MKLIEKLPTNLRDPFMKYFEKYHKNGNLEAVVQMYLNYFSNPELFEQRQPNNFKNLQTEGLTLTIGPWIKNK